MSARYLLFRKAAAPLVVLAGLLAAVPALAEASVGVGTKIDDAKLEAATGGKQSLFGKADVTILLFYKPGQDRSVETLKELAACEKTLATKSVRVVAVASSAFPKEEMAAAAKDAGLQNVAMLVDENDELYGKFEIRQHPVAIIVDKERKVAAVQPYTRLRYCDVLMAQVQFALKEIDQAALAAILEPPKAVMPSDDKAAVAKRNATLGLKYLAKGNCALALKSFEQALAADPTNAEAIEGKKKCEGGAAPAPSAAAAPAPAGQ